MDMTDAPAAFAGTFSDFRLVKGRKVVQIVVELPIEKGADFLTAFGMPDPGAERWVAIAALKAEPKEESKPKKTEGERAVQRAAILCEDPTFQRWLIDQQGLDGAPPGSPTVCTANAVETLRRHCRVSSRSQLATNEEARKKFEAIEAEFKYRDSRR